jgi:hypothetical protein
MPDLVSAILSAVSWAEAQGIPLPDDLCYDLACIKAKIPARDKKEPGKDMKEKSEQRIYRVMRRCFSRQQEKLLARLALKYPDRKAIAMPPGIITDDLFDDEDFDAEILAELILASKDGVALFGQSVTIGMDWTLTNSRAVEWARQYAFDLVKGINDTTRDALQTAISTFVETPGFTIGDVVNMLPYDESRALLIATTETTRAYAQANKLVGQDLKNEWPDVRVIKTWFTNRDAFVCDRCAPLNGQEVEVDEPFVHPETGEEYDAPPDPHPGCRCWDQVTTDILANA